MNEIKLVIWDLDETFWKGTLSEGEIEPVQENIQIVKTLTSRGIINSICSKNDFNQAKNKLQELGVWHHFVFPSIKWEAKGHQVQQIIDNCQLRAENVLFLDDNHLNREEVKYYNDGIWSKSVDFIHKHMDHPALKGKDDSVHSRLKQYKQLEEKFDEQQKYSSNEAFLRDSNIRITYIRDLLPIKDRIKELILRTNQLNFTKNRLEGDKVDSLLKQEEDIQFAIRVQDKFGNYGIVGYVNYDPTTHKLNHYVFSCRILNLGVEQFIYQKLGYPDIDIRGEVASSLSEGSLIDWIQEIHNGEESRGGKIISTANEKSTSQTKLLFTGSCELGSVLNYLQAYSNHIETNLVEVGENNLPEFPDHIITLLNSKFLTDQNHRKLLNLLPFVSDHNLRNKVFRHDYDVLIYSVVANYGQNVYRHKEHGFRIAWGEYDYQFTSDSYKRMMDYLMSRDFKEPNAFIEWFNSEFEHEGLLEPQMFKNNLQKLRKHLSDKIPIIFINGSEVNPTPEMEPEAKVRHKTMNNALDEFLSNTKNCYLVDVRNIADSSEDMGKTIRHFNRSVYKSVSDEIIHILKNDLNQDLKRELIEDLTIKMNYYLKMIRKKIISNKILYNDFTSMIYRNTIKKIIQ